MSAGRFVVLAIAPARSAWFRDLTLRATDGTLPAEVVKCLTVEELRARLASGRSHSAVLIDVATPGLDRDLVATARAAGCAVLGVGAGRVDCVALGADAALPASLEPRVLLAALVEHAPIVAGDAPAAPELRADDSQPTGAVVAVCGPGGTGVSTVAAALAQGLSTQGERVLLADLRREAEQAVLHDVGDAGGGLVELVEAHRTGAVEPASACRFAVAPADRTYDLLVGMHRPSAWTLLRPLAVEAAFATVRRAWSTTVCDVDADVEGERACGSLDVEERNTLARTAVLRARAVLVVGRPGVKGVHSLARTIRHLTDAGVGAERVLPVVNGAPRQPRARAEITAAIAALLPEHLPIWSPVFVPTRRIDAAWRDGVPLPSPLPELLTGAYLAVAARERDVAVAGARVVPGSLGLVDTLDGGDGA